VEVDVQVLVQVAIVNSGEQGAENSALSAFNGVVGVVANWFQIIFSLAPLIANALSDAPDPTMLLQAITQDVDEILQGLQALAAETKMLSLAGIIVPAYDRLRTLTLEGKHGPDINQPLFFSQAQDAAYAFGDDAYWIRPYLDSFVFSDSWFPNEGRPASTPYSGSDWVYDPQLPLPAFVLAISIFTGVVAIFHEDTNDAPTVQPYFTDLATLLETHHEKATNGLLTVPIPSIDDLIALSSASDQTGPLKDNFWSWDNLLWPLGFWRGEIGAIDSYAVFAKSEGSPGFALGEQLFPSLGPGTPAVISTRNAGNIIDPYPEPETMLRGFGDNVAVRQNVYRWFRIRMRIGNLARLKALYLTKGYDNIWSVVQKLRFLSSGKAGTPGSGYGPTPAPSPTNRIAHWCLSEFDAIISELDDTFGVGFVYEKFEENVQGRNVITAEDIISRLQAVIDYSTNRPWDEVLIPVETPRRPLSLRGTIASVAV
jgi:hypothetical protein